MDQTETLHLAQADFFSGPQPLDPCFCQAVNLAAAGPLSNPTKERHMGPWLPLV